METSGARRQRREVRHVLADRDAGSEQPRVGGSRHVGGVIDVQGVDPYQGGPRGNESLAGGGRQIGIGTEIALGAPVAREIGAHKDGLATQVTAWQGIRADRSAGTGDIGNDDRKVGEALEGKAGKVRTRPEPMPRRVDVGPGVTTEMQGGDEELGLAVVL